MRQHGWAFFLLALFATPVQAGRTLTDDSGRTVQLPGPAQRIVALAPHITEVLYTAGAGDKIVGTVDYSDYPPAARRIPRVGGYSRIDLEAVLALRPDLVIVWESGNNMAQADKLRALGLPVYVSQPNRLADIARQIERYGELAGTEATARPAAPASTVSGSCAPCHPRPGGPRRRTPPPPRRPSRRPGPPAHARLPRTARSAP